MFKNCIKMIAVAALAVTLPASLASAAKGGKSAGHRQDAVHGHHGGKHGNSASHRQDGNHKHVPTTHPA